MLIFFSPLSLGHAHLHLKDSGWFGLHALCWLDRASKELLSETGARKNSEEKQRILQNSRSGRMSWQHGFTAVLSQSILTRAAPPLPSPCPHL